jgi:hypothetical protein
MIACRAARAAVRTTALGPRNATTFQTVQSPDCLLAFINWPFELIHKISSTIAMNSWPIREMIEAAQVAGL